MKIGILGTRGIPNNYGGFEQFAQNFALYLSEKGYEVSVYNSSLHPYKKNTYKGVNIIQKYDPENKIGTAGQFVYDFLCILDSRKRGFDIILQLGYTSSSIFSFLFPVSANLITNMDGLEWKRSKYSKIVQTYLRRAEKWAVMYSDLLIADSIGIQDYIKEKYKCQSYYIPYSAEVFHDPDENCISAFDINKFNYNLVIARLEPENNIEIIIQSHIQTENKNPLLIIGSYQNLYGQLLYKKYNSALIRFLGAIYDQPVLNNLRYYSLLYLHGHSVGGTNPSLIEAMACKCLIVAHNNTFNKNILGTDAFYFDSIETLNNILRENKVKQSNNIILENNIKKISDIYTPERIHKLTEDLFKIPLHRVK